MISLFAFAHSEDLYVSSNARGAAILVNGVDTGYKAPATVPGVKVGETLVSVEGGCMRGEVIVVVAKGLTTRVSIVAAEQLGTLSLLPSPAAARLELDSAPFQGVPGVPLAVGCGSHTVRASLDGYITAVVTVEVEMGQDLSVPLNLPRLGLGSLDLSVTPRAGSILLDGRLVGSDAVSLPSVYQGVHVLSAELDGYQPVKKQVVVEDGGAQAYHFQLVRTSQRKSVSTVSLLGGNAEPLASDEHREAERASAADRERVEAREREAAERIRAAEEVKARASSAERAWADAERREAEEAAAREEERAAEERAAEKRAAEREAEERSAQERTTQRASERAAAERAAGERAAEERAAEERAAEERAAEERAAEERAAEERAAEERAAEERASDERATDERRTEERAAEERVAEERAAEERARTVRAREELATKERDDEERDAKERAVIAERAAERAEERAARDARAAASRTPWKGGKTVAGVALLTAGVGGGVFGVVAYDQAARAYTAYTAKIDGADTRNDLRAADAYYDETVVPRRSLLYGSAVGAGLFLAGGAVVLVIDERLPSFVPSAGGGMLVWNGRF